MADETPPTSPGSRLDRVADLFGEALGLDDPEALESLLSQVRNDDPALAEQLVSLLAAHAEDPTFLADPVTSELADIFGSRLDGAMVGRRVGAWQVDSVLHHGGMGTVYHAHRADVDFEQHAALKLIRVDIGSPELVRRFAQERRLLARLEHTNIARLLDGGSTPDGLPYLVMEHVRGETIDQWCAREQPSLQRLLEVFLQVCSAVDFAHQNLVIHQDIKPSNILVTPDGTAKLLDFGIADLERQASEDSDVPGSILLTPDYASPEQFRGDPASTATDTYSLGILLYRLLTGEAPYHITAGLTRAEAGRMAMEAIPRAPTAVIAKSGKPLPPRGDDLDAIVLRAVAKRPQDRYSSVLAFADDLYRYLDGRPVAARTPTWSYRLRRQISRNWVALSVAATIVILLVGGLAAALWQAGVAQYQRDLAQEEAATAASAVAFLKTVLGSGDPWRDNEPAETVDDVIRLAELELDSTLADQPAARAYVLSALGEVGAGRGDLERADRFTEAAVSLLLDSLGGTARQAGVIRNARALALHEMGRLDEAREHARAAVAHIESTNPAGWQMLATALNQLGAIEIDLGELAAAESTLVRATQLFHSRDQSNDMQLSAITNNLAVVYASLPGRLEEAAQAYAEASRILRLNGRDGPQLATLYVNQANVLTALQRYEEAEETFGRAIPLFTSSLGADHPATLTATASLGSLYETAGQYQRAVTLLRLTRRQAHDALPPDHPTTAYIESILGSSLCEMSDPAGLAEGLAAARAARDSRVTTLGQDHWGVASTEAIVGHCETRLGRIELGTTLLRNAHAALSAARGADHALTLRARRWLDEAEGVQITEADSPDPQMGTLQ